MATLHHHILIIGGGSAGITVAAQLLRADSTLDLAILEPSDKHYYQPAWTLVGAGAFNLQDTVREEKDQIPQNAKWIKSYASTFDPEANTVVTRDGTSISYDYLIVAAGIQLDWDGIPGLKESIGTKSVCSNYDYQYAEYTFETIKNFKGGTALFTQPATPIKCGGAPQKIMYLAEEYFRKNGVREKTNIVFATPGTVIFGVKKFANTLNKIITERNITTLFYHKLTEIRPDKKEAVYHLTSDPTGCGLIDDVASRLNITQTGDTEIVIPYDMIHTAPPQSAPDFIKKSPLAKPGDPYGFVDVNKETMQHIRFHNVFALGDVSDVPTAKTGAAVRKQAPALVSTLLTLMNHKKAKGLGNYNGYSSCPLVTGYSSMVLAEFDYDNNPAPSFPFDTSKERYSMWLLKKYGLPFMYWNMMLKGIA